MAITIDNVSSSNFGSVVVTSGVLAHTVGPSGLNQVLYVSVSTRTQTSPVSSIFYAGQSLTLYDKVTQSTLQTIETWYLANPPTGTNNIIIIVASPGSRITAGGVSLNGVATTAPATNIAEISGTSITSIGLNVIESNVGSWLYDAIALRTNSVTITPSGAQRQQWKQTSAGTNAGTSTSGAVSLLSLYGSGLGTYRMTETSTASVNYAYHAFAINPAGNNTATSMF